jgi:hypothetical protein
LILHALSLAAHDLLVGFEVLFAVAIVCSVLVIAGLVFGHWYAEKHPLPPVRLERGDFEREVAECLRVKGGGSRGPEVPGREAA